MVLHRAVAALLALAISGCANVSCRPDFVINTWSQPDGAPTAESGQPTVRQKLAEIESVSFISCDYDD